MSIKLTTAAIARNHEENTYHDKRDEPSGAIPFEYDPAALQELAEAQERYEGLARNLGVEFQEEVERVVTRLRRFPRSAPPWPDVEAPVTVRRALIARFPFALAYFEREDKIVIVAVAHTSRRPGYWRHRLTTH